MSASNPARPAALTLVRLLLDRLALDAAREVVFPKEAGRWVGVTGAQALARVRGLTLGLHELGVRRGDRVAILGETRPEWMLADLAVLSNGAATVGVYTTSPAPQVAHALSNSGARVIFYD